MNIDLNCDLGEGGENDRALLALITSANIACGAHAGDEDTMRRTVREAAALGVRIGAHPGFEDRENFGRIERPVTPGEASRLIRSQSLLLHEVAGELGCAVTHVKLHGALYNMAARDAALASAALDAIGSLPGSPAAVVLSGSVMEKLGRERRTIRIISEVFADRTYQRDGSLTPRSRPGALIEDAALAVAQVVRMVKEGLVRSVDGVDVPIRAETVCLHGDGAHAVEFAEGLRRTLLERGAEVAAF